MLILLEFLDKFLEFFSRLLEFPEKIIFCANIGGKMLLFLSFSNLG